MANTDLLGLIIVTAGSDAGSGKATDDRGLIGLPISSPGAEKNFIANNL
ncbi:MAG: hypothetical protein KKB37_08690 [Alphaproteobacteria bacterium]|nr:hypothetical protein [Alphaproteobacteria bacterium]